MFLSSLPSSSTRPNAHGLSARRAFPKLLLLTIALGFASAAPTSAAQQQLDLSVDLAAELLSQQSVAAGPDTEWNRHRINVQESGFAMLVPTYDFSDSQTTSEIKVLAKALWEETFFGAGGTVGNLRDGGTIAAFELDIFEGLDPDPTPTGSPASAEIQGPDASGTTVHLGTLYLYTPTEWATRQSQITTAHGGVPMVDISIWRGPVLHAAGPATSLRMQGSNNTVYGEAFGADDLLLGSDNWTARDLLTHVGTYTQFGSGHQLEGNLQINPIAQPAPFASSSSYISQAASAGQSFGGDLVILNDGNGGVMASDGSLLSGVVYASGDVIFDSSFVTTSVTVVAGGSINLVGTNNLLSSAVDGLLFWSLSTDQADSIALDANNSTMVGAIYGPSIDVRVGGSSNAFTGRLVADRLRTTGGLNVFSDGTE